MIIHRSNFLRGDEMVLHSLSLITDEETSGISVDKFRKSILARLGQQDTSKDDLGKILFHLSDDDLKNKSIRRLPYILFGKPNKNTFYLHGYDEEGKRLLSVIKKSLSFVMEIDGKEFNISKINDSIEKDYIPVFLNGGINSYSTSTPMLLFNDNSRKAVEGILYNPKNTKEEKDKQLIKLTNSLIKSSIQFIFQELTGKQKSIFETININWKEFKLIVIKDKDRKRFAVVGEFESDWSLPKFIGQRTGAGFGKITLAQRNKPKSRELIWEKY